MLGPRTPGQRRSTDLHCPSSLRCIQAPDHDRSFRPSNTSAHCNPLLRCSAVATGWVDCAKVLMKQPCHLWYPHKPVDSLHIHFSDTDFREPSSSLPNDKEFRSLTIQRWMLGWSESKLRVWMCLLIRIIKLLTGDRANGVFPGQSGLSGCFGLFCFCLKLPEIQTRYSESPLRALFQACLSKLLNPVDDFSSKEANKTHTMHFYLGRTPKFPSDTQEPRQSEQAHHPPG